MKTLYLGTALVVLAWCSGALGAPTYEPCGFTCAIDNNPCKGPDFPGTCNFHFEHEQVSMFVQCKEWGTTCYEMACPPGQYWKHAECACTNPNGDACLPNPCENGGACESSGDGFTCTCEPGWMGEKCETPDHCFSDPCKNGGSCENGDDGLTCICTPGWLGETCETPDFCFGDPCKNGGSCNNGDDGFVCTCVPPWIGDTCEDKPPGHDCSLEDSPCTGPDNPGTCNFHFQHFDSSKFVQCNEWGTQCFEMPCSPGTHWSQNECTCA